MEWATVKIFFLSSFSGSFCPCVGNQVSTNTGWPNEDEQLYPIGLSVDTGSCRLTVNCTGFAPIIFTVPVQQGIEDVLLPASSSYPQSDGRTTIIYNKFFCVFDPESKQNVWAPYGQLNIASKPADHKFVYNAVECTGAKPPALAAAASQA